MNCNICPRNCKIDEIKNYSVCGNKKLKVAKYFLHKWEEPCISGSNGSGTIFFSGCNLKCVFCQNYKISQEHIGIDCSNESLKSIIINLKEQGAHNINLVSPMHYIDNIREVILSINNLTIPIIYNTNSYEKVEKLKTLKGLVDVYLPDLKYFENEYSLKYSKINNYFTVATQAILEMYNQVGSIIFDPNGLIVKGVIIRHLVLPGMYKDSIKILNWIKENFSPNDIRLSIMSQYTPQFKAKQFKEIDRSITKYEYKKVLEYLMKTGFDGYIQDKKSADIKYIPEFS